MRILLYSDLHLHLWKQFGVDEKTGLPNRFLDQILILRQIGKIIKARDVKLVVNGGDTIHKVGEISTVVLNLAKSEFEKWGVDQVFVDGNHDMIDRKDPKWYQLSSKAFSKDVIIPEELKIKLIGYNDSVEEVEGYDIVIVHKTPIGCMVGNYTFSDGVDWTELASRNRLVFFGHIHQKQKLSDNCFVMGSPLQLNFGDSGDRGVYIVDTDDWSIEFIKLKYKEFITVNKGEDVDTNNKENYYRVFLSSEDDKAKSENVLSVSVPVYYDERIKSESTLDILKEWCEINKKPSVYFNFLEKLIKECNLYSGEVFKGRIQKVKIKDFFSVGEVEYEVEKGFTFIEGETDLLMSNGAGKSSMFGDAIYWGLFGETTKGIKGNDVIRFGCEDCKIEVELSGDKSIKITRSRKKGIEVFVDGNEIWEGEKDSEKQTKIEQSLLGFSKDFFKTASYFSQEDLKMLTLMGDVDRNNMIIHLLGFELYDEMYNRVSVEFKKLEGELESKFKEELETKNKISSLQDKISGSNDKLEFLSKEREKIEARFTDREHEMRKAMETINAEIDDLSCRIKEAVVDEIDSKEESRLAKIREAINNNVSTLRSSISKQEFIISESSNRKNKIEKLGDKCPTCLNDITQNHKNQLLTEYEDKSKDASSILHKNKTMLEQEEEKLKKVTEKERELVEKKNDRDKQLIILKRNKEDLKKLELRFEESTRSIENLLGDKKKEACSIEKDIDGVKKESKKYEEALNENTETINSILTAVKKLNEDSEMMLFWKESFGSKGIKSLLLDRFCNEFNKIIVEYISTVSGGEISTLMSPKRTLKSGEERNKLDVLVYIDNRERVYQSLSGGEKRRVDVAICLALNEWCGRKFGIPFGFLGTVILDEVFSYIDKKGEESIANLLTEEGLRKSIIVISHTSDLANYSDRIWKVKKDNGISKLIK